MNILKRIQSEFKAKGSQSVAQRAVLSAIYKALPYAVWRYLYAGSKTQPIKARTCPKCQYSGRFIISGSPPRIDAKCPKCGTLERHRLLWLAYEKGLIFTTYDHDLKIIHFAAEAELSDYFKTQFPGYQTADLFEKSDLKVDMENMNIEGNQYDIVIANHVLEHVDDTKATNEIFRILKPGGRFICMVPIIEAWDETYEASYTDPRDRKLHFGQNDHVRYYGSDFQKRISASGLRLVSTYTAEGPDVATFGLLRGEKVFIFERPTGPQEDVY